MSNFRGRPHLEERLHAFSTALSALGGATPATGLIETAINGLHGDDRAHLLAALIEKEFLYRLDRGETPDAAEFEARFPAPGDLQVVHAFFGEVEADADPLVDRYEIQALIATGGLSEVLKARDKEIGRVVALKQPLMGVGDNTLAFTRLEREAGITAELEHPNIIPVYSRGNFRDQTPFFTMRFVDGKSLRAVIRELHGRSDAARPERGES